MKEIASHTAIRGVASLGVVIYHLNLGIPPEYSADRLTGVVSAAYVGVDLFFILSGFILAAVYEGFFATPPSHKELQAFYISRFARIYPLHALTLVFMASFSGLQVLLRGGALNFNLADFVESALLVQAWGFAQQFKLNFPAWSVSVEFAAYLLFPVLIAIFRRGVSPILVIAAVAIAYIGLYWAFGGLNSPEEFSLLRGMPAFALGMALQRFKNAPTGISEPALSAIQFAAITLIVAAMHFRMNDILLMPAFCALVLSCWQDRGACARLIANPVFRRLGEWSYSIYLLHIPVRNVGFLVWPKIGGEAGAPAADYGFAFSVVAVTIALSALSYRFFEKPARDYVRRLLHAETGALPATQKRRQ